MSFRMAVVVVVVVMMIVMKGLSSSQASIINANWPYHY